MSEVSTGAATLERSTVAEALGHLRTALKEGRSWPRALLEAVALWTLPEEEFRGRRLVYLIQGEALDWLALAERLLAEVEDLVPPPEREALVFSGVLPEWIAPEEFRGLLGPLKYGAYLNYWYGVVVEQALQEAVEEDVCKSRRSRGRCDQRLVTEEAYQFIYGASQEDLLARFRAEHDLPQKKSTTLTETRAFTYWLFKLRLRSQDSARIASDTRRGLDHLHSAFPAQSLYVA